MPFPCIAELLDKLSSAKYTTSVDLATAYQYVRIAKGNMHKIAFSINKSLYEYVVIPFGLCNMPVTF